ncbi:MAG: hypothetical protein AAF564_05270 [Bacteroidota bacterium]
MQDRSKLIMLAGLGVLFLAVIQITGAPSFGGFHRFVHFGGALPWILLAVGFWLFFGKNGGCCKKGNEAS